VDIICLIMYLISLHIESFLYVSIATIMKHFLFDVFERISSM
jgi:hypothetical protein